MHGLSEDTVSNALLQAKHLQAYRLSHHTMSPPDSHSILKTYFKDKTS